MRAYQRLLNYVTHDTGSDDRSSVTPSTPAQAVFADMLAEELRALGVSGVFVDEHAYVYGCIPATAGYEACQPVGFIAHLDTNADSCGGGAKPQVIAHYDGGEVTLGSSGLLLSPKTFPHLASLKGKTLITTDGTSVLGADDKAGIAEIITLCERLLSEDTPHGAVRVCFTPDEEIGHGAALLDLQRFGAAFAYTVDGSSPSEIEYETFNAARAKWEIHGVSVHPAVGKGVLVNAALVAMEINAMLPSGETPRETWGREGFYHLLQMEGSVSSATLDYIIREHDAALFEGKKQRMIAIEEAINRKYGSGIAHVTLYEQYRNMAEIIEQHPHVLEYARKAIRALGMVPATNPVRGGTDGAQLSFRGLPCPNLGNGAYAFHGPYEHAVAEEMDQVVDILMGIVGFVSEKTKTKKGCNHEHIAGTTA